MQVIFISAYSEIEYARAALRLKSIDYVLKPIDRYALYEALDRAMCAFGEAMLESVRRSILNRHIDEFQARCIEDLLTSRVGSHELNDIAVDLRDMGAAWGAIAASPCPVDALRRITQNVLSSVNAIRCTFMCAFETHSRESFCVFALKSRFSDRQFDLLCDQLRMLLQIEGNAGVSVRHSGLVSSLLDLSGFATLRPCEDSLPEHGDVYADMIAAKIEAIIRERFADKKLSVNAIAKEMHYSSSYICTLYRRRKAITINDYINLYRIARVKETIRTQAISFSSVALMTGFDNEAYMSRVFKKLEGVPPSIYRRRLEG